MPSTFLTAEWRKLIMAQYTVPPETLLPWLPAGVELDFYKERCYVSLVGFLFDQVRVKGLPIPFHTQFEEINLRFYVKRIEPDGGLKRGVVFIREFVPRAAITLIANVLYEEPYATLPTRHSVEPGQRCLKVRYDFRFRNMWQSIAVEASPESRPITPGSEEEFITEHYWGYTKRKDGSTSAYEVKHPKWKCYPVHRYAIATCFGRTYGSEFGMLDQQQPSSVLLAEGSEVSVLGGLRLQDENGV